jgi:hypothetical protein
MEIIEYRKNKSTGRTAEGVDAKGESASNIKPRRSRVSTTLTKLRFEVEPED